MQVPYLVGNADIGYVQTRWVFTNPEESYLTKVLFLLPPLTSQNAGHRLLHPTICPQHEKFRWPV